MIIIFKYNRLKQISLMICVAILSTMFVSAGMVTLTGSQLGGVNFFVPGSGASASYAAGQITLTSPDNVGGGSGNQFNDTAYIIINNGYDGVTLGNLSSFLASGSSFNLASMTSGGLTPATQYAYWNMFLTSGANTMQINAYSLNTTGNNNIGSTYGATAYLLNGVWGDYFAPWSSVITDVVGGTALGNWTVSAVSIDVGGWDTGTIQIGVIDSVTLTGGAVPDDCSAAILLGIGFAGLALLFFRQPFRAFGS